MNSTETPDTDPQVELQKEPSVKPSAVITKLETKIAKLEDKLIKIANVYNKEYKDKKGTVAMTHMGYNLQGAIIDLKSGKNDKVVTDTLERVGEQVAEIARILGPDLIWDKEVEKIGKLGK